MSRGSGVDPQPTTVAAFCATRSRSVVPATLAEIAKRNAAFDLKFSRKVVGLGSSSLPLALLLLPLLGYFALVRAVVVPAGLLVSGLSQLVGRLFGRRR